MYYHVCINFMVSKKLEKHVRLPYLRNFFYFFMCKLSELPKFKFYTNNGSVKMAKIPLPTPAGYIIT